MIMVVISAQNETLLSTTVIHSQHTGGFGMENIIESISNIFFAPHVFRGKIWIPRETMHFIIILPLCVSLHIWL